MSQRAALIDYGRELARALEYVEQQDEFTVVRFFVKASEQIHKRYDAAFNATWLDRIVVGADLTQVAIAQALGVARATITHFREGKASVSLRDRMEVLFGHFLDEDPPLRRTPRSELRNEALIAVVRRMSDDLNRDIPLHLDRLRYEYLRRITAMDSWWQGQETNDVQNLDRAVEVANEEVHAFFRLLASQNYPGLSVPACSDGKMVEEVENLFRWWQPLCHVVKEEIACFNRSENDE